MKALAPRSRHDVFSSNITEYFGVVLFYSSEREESVGGFSQSAQYE